MVRFLPLSRPQMRGMPDVDIKDLFDGFRVGADPRMNRRQDHIAVKPGGGFPNICRKMNVPICWVHIING